MLIAGVTFAAAFAFVWGVATVLDRRRRRRAPRRGAVTAGCANGPERDTLATMDSRRFEARVLDAFQAKGYRLAGPHAGCGELVLRRDHETCLVDCRHWRESKVGVKAIERLQLAMRTREATSAFILTRGRYSRDATAAAGVARIRLIDGRTLGGLVETPVASGRR